MLSPGGMKRLMFCRTIFSEPGYLKETLLKRMPSWIGAGAILPFSGRASTGSIFR
jgi:hypothetical protein